MLIFAPDRRLLRPRLTSRSAACSASPFQALAQLRQRPALKCSKTRGRSL